METHSLYVGAGGQVFVLKRILGDHTAAQLGAHREAYFGKILCANQFLGQASGGRMESDATGDPCMPRALLSGLVLCCLLLGRWLP